MKQKIFRITYITTTLLSILGIFFSNINLMVELSSHFQIQLLIFLTILLVYGLIIKKYYDSIVIGIYIFIIIFKFVLPIILFENGGNNAQLYFHNMLYYNKSGEQITNYLNNNNYKYIAIVEYNNSIQKELEKKYGKPDVIYDKDVYSCAIFSQDNPIDKKIINNTYPICQVEYEDFILIAVHPFPPLNDYLRKKQYKFFEELSSHINNINKSGKKFILVGDFNSSIYNKIFRKHFLQYYHKNIYTRNTKSIISLPIDHGLSNFPIKLYKGKTNGSDHNAILIQY